MIAAFTLEGISGGNAVFNPEKLEWFNGQHLARLSADELTAAARARRCARPGSGTTTYRVERREWFHEVLELLKPRAKKVADLAEQGRYFFTSPVDYEEAAVKKHLALPGMAAHLEAWREVVASVEPFDAVGLEAALRRCAERARDQGGRPDSRHPHRHHRAGRQPESLRGSGARRPRRNRRPPPGLDSGNLVIFAQAGSRTGLDGARLVVLPLTARGSLPAVRPSRARLPGTSSFTHSIKARS